MSRLSYITMVVAGGIFLLAVLFAISLLPRGVREVAALTNVHGIPFSPTGDWTEVTQALAHTDVYLREPVAFKKLLLTFEYVPHDSRSLAVGVRENSFWLSYAPITFYEASDTTANEAPRTATVELPLTDKLQDVDHSIDVLFIANGQTEGSLKNELADTTKWHIRNLQARTVVETIPPRAALKDYLRSILTRERPL